MASSQTGATHGSPGNNNNPSGERGREKGEEKRREKGESEGRDAPHHPPDASGIEKRRGVSAQAAMTVIARLAACPRRVQIRFPDFSRQRKSRVFLSRFSKPGEKYIASKEGKTHGYARKLRGGMKKKKKK